MLFKFLVPHFLQFVALLFAHETANMLHFRWRRQNLPRNKPCLLILKLKGIDNTFVGYFTFAVFRLGQHIVTHPDLLNGSQTFFSVHQRSRNKADQSWQAHFVQCLALQCPPLTDWIACAASTR